MSVVIVIGKKNVFGFYHEIFNIYAYVNKDYVHNKNLNDINYT